MREVSKRDRDSQIEIEEIFKDTHAELEQAQITAFGMINDFVKFVAKRPKPKPDNPQVSQTSSNHQLSKTETSMVFSKPQR